MACGGCGNKDISIQRTQTVSTSKSRSIKRHAIQEHIRQLPPLNPKIVKISKRHIENGVESCPLCSSVLKKMHKRKANSPALVFLQCVSPSCDYVKKI